MSNYVTLLDLFPSLDYDYSRECDTMIYPSIDKLLNIVDSKYELVHIAARRSKEISKTDYLQMPENEYKCKKNIGRALEEVSEGLLTIRKS